MDIIFKRILFQSLNSFESFGRLREICRFLIISGQTSRHAGMLGRAFRIINGGNKNAFIELAKYFESF
jgi:hypothetical protein